MYIHRVKVPAREGSFIKTFDGAARSRLKLLHSRNIHNVYVLITSWVTLLADTPLSIKPRTVYNKFFNELVNDLFGSIERLSDLGDELAKSLIHGDEGVTTTHFIHGMKDTPIFKEYLAFYRSHDTQLLTFILTVCSFGSKLYYEDPTFDTVALRDWFEVEEKLGDLEFPAPLIRFVRHIMSSIFSDWSTGPMLPKHGSGRVAEDNIWGSNSKNSNLQMPPKIAYMFRTFVSDDGVARYLPVPDIPQVSRSSLSISQLKFVPKNWKKTRSICMEPIAFQWAQQAVRLWYEDHLSSCYLGKYVTIRDQTNNQDGSKFGSDSGLVDTIDLSSASDSVSWELVRRIFPAKVLKYLAATRTSEVRLPNKVDSVSVRKFAPMGSALCFPVQSTIYSSIVIAAMIMHARSVTMEDLDCLTSLDISKEVRELTFRHFTYETNKFQPFRVYGDDIICDHRITSLTIRLLRTLGFRVNESKSFIGEQAYRESCGTHHFDGCEVTPFFFKVKKIDVKIGPGTVTGIIDHCNRAFDYGFLNLRRHLKNLILYYPILNVRKGLDGKNPILFSSNRDDSVAIFTSKPRNSHLRLRSYVPGGTYEKISSRDTFISYQRDEIRSVGVTAKERVDVDSIFDNYRYVLWQRSRYHHTKPVEDFLTVGDADARGTRMTWRWTPKSE